MNKKIALILLGLIAIPSMLFSWNRGASWDEGDLYMRNNSIVGDSTNGIKFDPDNDGTDEITFGIDGSITASSMTITELNLDNLNVTYGINATTGVFSGAVEVATLDTGQGANELYDMDQDVLQASDVTFDGLTVSTITVSNETQALSIKTTSIYGDGNDSVAIGASIGTRINFNAGGAGSADINCLTNFSDGNVGIGSDAPTEKLEVVNGNIKTNYGINATTGVFSGLITASSVTASTAFICSDGTIMTSTSTFGGGSSLWTETGSDIYYNTGNVGIGDTNPTEAPLVVRYDNGAAGQGMKIVNEQLAINGDQRLLTLGWTDTSADTDGWYLVGEIDTDNTPTTAFKINASGNFYTPGYYGLAGTFEVGTNDLGCHLFIEDYAKMADADPVSIEDDGGNVHFTLLDGGNIGVGTTVAAEKFTVNGNLALGASGTSVDLITYDVNASTQPYKIEVIDGVITATKI